MRAAILALALVSFCCVALALAASSEDDPWEAWEEWGETKESKESEKTKPRRLNRVDLKPGKKINVDALMGSVPRKMMLFFVNGEFGDDEHCNTLVSRWRDQLRAGGVAANIGCVSSDQNIVGRAESQRDVYNAKDFLLRFPQVKSVKIEHQEFTEPRVDRDDLGADEDDDEDEEEL